VVYAVLCYNLKDAFRSPAEDATVMGRLRVVQDKRMAEGKLGSSLRLLLIATTLRNSRNNPLVIDGPFAETKEHLLGFRSSMSPTSTAE
jgi:hypothetical protein